MYRERFSIRVAPLWKRVHVIDYVPAIFVPVFVEDILNQFLFGTGQAICWDWSFSEELDLILTKWRGNIFSPNRLRNFLRDEIQNIADYGPIIHGRMVISSNWYSPATHGFAVY